MPDEPVARARRCRRGPGPSSRDLELERLRAVADGDRGGRARRRGGSTFVTASWTIRYADGVERRRERRAGRPRRSATRRAARRARAVQHLVQPVEPGCGARVGSSRSSRSVRCISPIVRRPSAAIASVASRTRSSPAVAPQRLRLDDHQRHVVADGVVQLARDPQPLLASPPARRAAPARAPRAAPPGGGEAAEARPPRRRARRWRSGPRPAAARPRASAWRTTRRSPATPAAAAARERCAASP